jgi:hypothetical protein
MKRTDCDAVERGSSALQTGYRLRDPGNERQRCPRYDAWQGSHWQVEVITIIRRLRRAKLYVSTSAVPP